MLKRLLKPNWHRARLIHLHEGEIWLERSQCEFKLIDGLLILKTVAESESETSEAKRFEMEAYFKEEDISYIAYYTPSPILTLS